MPPLRVVLTALGCVDAEDWARVRVEIQSGGFIGDFEAWLQSCDLDAFLKQLDSLYERVGQAGDAVLQCSERGIFLTLSMRIRGDIEGRFEFFDERTSTVLSGAFNADQSYIPGWCSAVKSLREELSNHAL